MKPVAPVTRAVRPSPGRLASPAMPITLVLFTRDLRVRDNPALAAAARRGDVVPLFVLDEVLLSGRSGTPNRIAFLLDSLHDLDRSLRDRGARLLIRRGDPVDAALEVARRAGADAIHVAEDVSGYAHRRQARLERACRRSRHRAASVLGGHGRSTRRARTRRRRPLPRLHPVLARVAVAGASPGARRPARPADADRPAGGQDPGAPPPRRVEARVRPAARRGERRSPPGRELAARRRPLRVRGATRRSNPLPARGSVRICTWAASRRASSSPA